MSVSKKLIEVTLWRFALLFDAPEAARASWNDAVDCWHGLIGHMPEAEFSAQAAALACTLTRFPVPADFVWVNKPKNNTKESLALDGQAVGAMAVQGV